MKRTFDRLDLFAAVGLFVAVAAWAFLWAHPCPHPDLWPFLVAVQGRIGTGALGVAGRLALGAFAAFAYLVLRGVWFLQRDRHDHLPDSILYTRTAPVCGAAVIALLPPFWRAGQFLSPDFALLALTAVGLFFWLRGRGGRGLLAYSLAYFLICLVCALNPLGFAALVVVAVSDVIVRWKDGQRHGQREDDELATHRKSIEAWFSVIAGTVGFLLGVCVIALFPAERGTSFDPMERILFWLKLWTGSAVKSAFSPLALALALSVLFSLVGLAVGRRLRSLGRHGLTMCRVLSVLLALLALAMLLRSVDRPERIRLEAVREYASLVADDIRGKAFLFADGRFDDLLRLEFRSRGLETVVLNTMSAPSPAEAVRLRALAPEPGDRALFEAGGAEVFKAWARERPDRLAACAWQLGNGIVRRYGKAQARTHGTVVRCGETPAADDAADARLVEWTQRVGALAETHSPVGSLFGGTDDAVAAKFDALLWRAARLADERAERLASARDAEAAERERQTRRRLDALNASLRRQGEVAERMLPTEKLVLTPRESLDVALKRADFDLARRYAGEILAGAPDDPAANFALGMANLEAKEYFRASVCFEKALRTNPDEPAALNNLAIAYMKLGQVEKALKCAERAAKIYPKSAQIQQTLAEIRKNQPKDHR